MPKKSKITKKPRTVKKKKSKELKLVIPQENTSAKKLLWFGVIAFTVVIFGLWGWAMKTHIASVQFKVSPEGQLLKKSQTEWNKLFQETKQEQDSEKMLAKIKEYFKQIVAMIPTSTTDIATSTIVTSTISATTTLDITNATIVSSTLVTSTE